VKAFELVYCEAFVKPLVKHVEYAFSTGFMIAFESYDFLFNIFFDNANGTLYSLFI
jgi:hypothetical protein